MPARPTLTIEQSNGDTRATLTCITAQRTKNLVESWSAVAVVDRSDWLAVEPTVDEIDDKFYINRGDGTTFWGGRFDDDERDGNTVRVMLSSPERDAKDAEPTGGNLEYTSTADSTIVQNALNNVSTLTAGTLQTGESNVNINIANADQSKVIRMAAEPAGMDVRYASDWTVDFLTRLGSDKPNTTISNASQNVIGDLNVNVQSRDPVTHIKGLGGQDGPNQIEATATIASYSGGREVWREYVNKDVLNQSRLQSIVDRLATQYDSERRRIVVEASVVDTDLSIGDSPTVTLPDHDIDRLLRINRVTEHIGPNPRLEMQLTNRKPERGGTRKLRDDVGRFNTGYAGFIDRDNFRAVERQPVDTNLNATGEYEYPSDVETEITAELTVRSIPYRGYTSGTVDNADFSNAATEHAFNATVSWAGSNWFNMGLFSPTSRTSYVIGAVNLELLSTPVSGDNSLAFRLRNDSTGYIFPDQTGVEMGVAQGERVTFFGVDSTDCSGQDLYLEVKNLDADTIDAGEYKFSTWWFAAGPHTHGQDPGVVEFGNTEASNVDVIIDGNTAATNIGSGTFTTTVDISGEFTPGVNPIEISSDSTGFISAYVTSELHRRGDPSP